MNEELNQEEQDNLLRNELTQGINWDEEETYSSDDENDVWEIFSNDDEETYSSDENNEENEDNDEDKRYTSKPKSKIAKVLHQRNEARKEVENYKSEVEVLKSKLEKLEADWEYWSEEYVQTLIDKRMAENDEKNNYFDNKQNIKPFKKEILNYQKESWLSLDKATKLYLAENRPDLLLDEQTKNKQRADTYNTNWYTPSSLKTTKTEFSSSELERKIARWEVRL